MDLPKAKEQREAKENFHGKSSGAGAISKNRNLWFGNDQDISCFRTIKTFLASVLLYKYFRE
jgi:hypothetical protein